MLMFSKSSSSHFSPTKAKGKIGVVFCGRQTPGAHDIIHGIVSFAPPGWEVVGFVGGTAGFLAKQEIPLTSALTKTYARTGGLDLLSRSQDKLECNEKTMQVCQDCNLDALLLLGGARSNMDALRLAENLHQRGCKTAVVTIPMGIGGSLQAPFIEQSIGFDSNSKAVARLVGNTAVDGASARKYWYFLRIMEGSSVARGTPTSHVTLEVALQTKPNYCIFSEAISKNHESLEDVVNKLCDVICKRADNKKNFGTVLVPDNILGAVSEFATLVQELQRVNLPQAADQVIPQLSAFSAALLKSLPDFIRNQILSTKQSNAAVALSQVETEQLIADLAAQELNRRKAAGTYSGSFSSVCQFLGYQARCSAPSNFDSNLGYALGGAACHLAMQEKNGYMVSASGVTNKASEWKVIGVPITTLVEVDQQHEPIISPKQLDLNGPAVRAWNMMAEQAAMEELYENPGPIQFSGKTQDSVTKHISSLSNADNYVYQLTQLRAKMDEISAVCRPGCETRLLRVANSALDHLGTTIREITCDFRGPKRARVEDVNEDVNDVSPVNRGNAELARTGLSFPANR